MQYRDLYRYRVSRILLRIFCLADLVATGGRRSPTELQILAKGTEERRAEYLYKSLTLAYFKAVPSQKSACCRYRSNSRVRSSLILRNIHVLRWLRSGLARVQLFKESPSCLEIRVLQVFCRFPALIGRVFLLPGFP